VHGRRPCDDHIASSAVPRDWPAELLCCTVTWRCHQGLRQEACHSPSVGAGTPATRARRTWCVARTRAACRRLPDRCGRVWVRKVNRPNSGRGISPSGGLALRIGNTQHSQRRVRRRRHSGTSTGLRRKGIGAPTGASFRAVRERCSRSFRPPRARATPSSPATVARNETGANAERNRVSRTARRAGRRRRNQPPR